MKLCGWIHRKFRQNSSGEGFIDNGSRGTGNSCNCLSGCRGSPEDYRQCYSTTSPTTPFENGEKFINVHRDGTVEPFIFDGAFLSIGTLGFTSINEEEEEGEQDELESEVSVIETITGKQEETMTVDELIAVSAELEKALVTETDHQQQSQDHVVATAANTLPAGEGNKCPLQEYLFGSPVVTDSERREHRASLGELFMRSREWEEMKIKEEDVDLGGLLKKKSKNKIKHRGSSSSKKKITGSNANGDGDDGESSAGKKAKLNKILQIFYRKVHPESCLEAKKKSSRNSKNKNNNNNKPVSYNEGIVTKKLVESMSPTNNTCRNQKFQLIYRTHSKPSLNDSVEHGGPTVNNCGQWIKTDSEYVVLEL